MKLSDEIKKKYRKILNNLLDVKPGDASLFTRVENVNYFDLTSKFNSEITKKFWNAKVIESQVLDDQDTENMLAELKSLRSGDAVIALFERYNEKLAKVAAADLLKPDKFSLIHKTLVTRLSERVLKKTLYWKAFVNRANEINIQTNIWPLHVAAAFISYKNVEKTLYAPLLLREVNLTFKNNVLHINTAGDWKINEKVIFILESLDIKISDDIFFENMSALEAWKTLVEKNPLLQNYTTLDETASFTNLVSDNIEVAKINILPGIVLGLFIPSGGAIRKTMVEILGKNEIDDIFDVIVNKNIYREAVHAFVEKRSSELVRITSSNYSQDKAIISALIQDTIIFGPPGTGKSQVIANLIANIFLQKKSAIVMSQKKAALDVLKNRLGGIAPFALFVLNNNQMDKVEFYKFLRKFVELIENYNQAATITREELITETEITTLKRVSEIKLQKQYRPSIKLLRILQENTPAFLTNAFKLDPNLEYVNKILDKKEYIAALAEKNNIKKTGTLIKSYPDSLKTQSEVALEILKINNQLNINDIKANISNTTAEAVQTLYDAAIHLRPRGNAPTNEKELVTFLANQILEKINKWERIKMDERRAYARFAEDVRAGWASPIKFLEKHKTIIKELFPIIITTPDSSFITWEKKHYDYAILDEASQIQTEVGLSILYLAKTKVLAGDNQQMKPTNWFSIQDATEETEGSLESGVESILDYAKAKGIHEEMLDQNFRSSAAALMSFSAKNFYNAALEVIDQNGAKITEPIVVKNVSGLWEEGINKIEAAEVIAIAKTELPKFNKVILLAFNVKQKDYIEEEIIEKEPELFAAMQAEKLMIRNIENIQGDEADVVIASIVYDPTTNVSSTYVARPGGKNALNVAISRARDQMIIVKSVSADTIKTAGTDDFFMFREWLAFLEKTPAERRNYVIINSLVEQTKTVAAELLDSVKNDIYENLNTMAQPFNMYVEQGYIVGSKMIDIAVISKITNKVVLGLSIDQYNYNSKKLVDSYLTNATRNDFLRKKNYEILQISEVDWVVRKSKILAKIANLIAK